MAFAQLTYRESLRDIEVCLAAGCQLMRLENGRLSLYSSATDFHNAR